MADIAKDRLVAGVDEAGRGCLAGPVAAGAVILPEAYDLPGLTDSKKLTPAKREALAPAIKAQALAWAVAFVWPGEIDRINILQASLLAMQRAVSGLSLMPQKALVDGNKCPVLACPVEAIVGGDGKVAAIAAASILAKTVRDAQMQELHVLYPQYGFDRHKGYPTALHLAALREHGISPVHRRSYGPVAQLMLL